MAEAEQYVEEIESTSEPESEINKKENELDNKLTNSVLSKTKLLKWSIYEWFYSEIDKHFFKENHLRDTLVDMGLGNVERLTAPQWRYVRSLICNNWYGMAGPRRFSCSFTKEEREKLHKERENTRKLYQDKTHAQNNEDDRHPIPPETKVIALYPKTHSLKDGVVVKAWENNMYHIRFDTENGSDILPVQDHHVMLVPSENQMKKGVLSEEENYDTFSEEPRSVKKKLHFGKFYSPSGNVGTPEHPTSPPADSLAPISLHFEDVSAEKTETGENLVYSIYKKEDLERVCKLYSLLSQKEKLQEELTNLNDEADERKANQQQLSPDFHMYYVWIFLKLGKINKQIEVDLSALKKRQHEIFEVYPHLANAAPSIVPVRSKSQNTPTYDLVPSLMAPSSSSPSGEMLEQRMEVIEDTSNVFDSDVLKAGGGSAWYSKFAAKCNLLSENLVRNVIQQLDKEKEINPDGQNVVKYKNEGQKLITRCVNLLHNISLVANQNLEEREVRLVLDAALTSIRPQNKSKENMKLYQEIQSSTRKLQEYLTMRSDVKKI